MGNNESKKSQDTLTPAQQSARAAEEVNKKEKAQRATKEKDLDEARAAEAKIVEAEAQKMALGVYSNYRQLITEAARAGKRTLRTDMNDWSGSYYGKQPEISPEKLRELTVENKARELAREMLKRDGYQIKRDGWQKDTAWGVGSDSLPTAGESCQWIDISW